jgi:lysophospholipase L1-like esterase
MPAGKGSIEPIEGKVGKALRFSFGDNCQGVFATGPRTDHSGWDQAAGFSFWVKGDGSSHLGGIEFIWNEDYAMRYAYAFPIDSTEWRKIVVSWKDLIPESSKILLPVDPRSGNAPSKLGPFSFGKWWYWKDYAAHSYVIDEIRLEPTIVPDTKTYRPAGAPLERIMRKLKAGKPITIVTMGDSLTDVDHWTNRQTNWPTMLQTALHTKYGSVVRIVNPAMGGTELRNNVILMPRWLKQAPEPDLVTVFFGNNDWNSGMRGDGFCAAQQDAVERIRRATGGRADVLLMTTCPTFDKPDALGEMAEACRKAARAAKAGSADVYAAFRSGRQEDRERLYATDKVHLSQPGQNLVAETVLHALTQ